MPLIARHDHQKIKVPFTDIYIVEPLPNRNPKNAFVVTVNVMFGDADFYEDIKFEFSEKEEKTLLQFLTFLNLKVAPAYSNGRGGDDRYETVIPEWKSWFGYDEDTEVAGRFCDEWPSNWDIGGEATLEHVDVVYYNIDGTPHSVELDHD